MHCDCKIALIHYEQKVDSMAAKSGVFYALLQAAFLFQLSVFGAAPLAQQIFLSYDQTAAVT